MISLTRLARGILLALALAAFSHGGNAREVLPPPEIIRGTLPVPVLLRDAREEYIFVEPVVEPIIEYIPDPICGTTVEADYEVYKYIGYENVDLFRITTCEIWEYGDGSVQAVVEQESDAMILTRAAMGENTQNLAERIYIMWFIRMRAELGYKNAGQRGWEPPDDRWWYEPTSIKKEALCIGGCQIDAVRLWQNIYFPANLKEGQLSAMIYPSTAQIVDFYLTYEAAKIIVDAPMSDYPEELRGYDEFRAGSITREGLYYQEGGLPSKAFYKDTAHNTFRDVSPWDNVFWENLKGELNGS